MNNLKHQNQHFFHQSHTHSPSLFFSLLSLSKNPLTVPSPSELATGQPVFATSRAASFSPSQAANNHHQPLLRLAPFLFFVAALLDVITDKLPIKLHHVTPPVSFLSSGERAPPTNPVVPAVKYHQRPLLSLMDPSAAPAGSTRENAQRSGRPNGPPVATDKASTGQTSSEHLFLFLPGLILLCSIFVIVSFILNLLLSFLL